MVTTDIKLNFIEGDIMFSANSDFEKISDLDNLKQAIKSRLLTKYGDLFSQSNYGSNLYLLIGETITEDIKVLASSYVYESLENEPRIKEIKEVIIESEGNKILNIKIIIIPEDSETDLDISIDYTL